MDDSPAIGEPRILDAKRGRGLRRRGGHTGPRRGCVIQGPVAKRKLLELDSRMRIYEHIRKVPGIHMRRLERELAIPMSTLEYHLYQLERHGLVAAHKEGQKKAYFVREDVDARDQHYLYYLRQRRARRILLEILNNPDVTLRDLTKQLELGAPTVSYHLKKLRKAEIIEPVWLGRNKQYEIVEPERLLRLVDTYRQTFRGLRREDQPQPGPAPFGQEQGPLVEATIQTAIANAVVNGGTDPGPAPAPHGAYEASFSSGREYQASSNDDARAEAEPTPEPEPEGEAEAALDEALAIDEEPAEDPPRPRRPEPPDPTSYSAEI